MVERWLKNSILNALDHMPAVAILGPRQCGKTTLARVLADLKKPVVFLDLERPADRAKLTDPEAYFSAHKQHLICIDEIQRAPDIFPVIRYIIDKNAGNGQFLILGSASRDLIRQSSESLAGRVRYLNLTPFLWPEIANQGTLREYWLRGGFPRSWLAVNSAESYQWRMDFIRDFLERDIPALKPRIDPRQIERLLRMLAHTQGQLLNASVLATSMGISSQTIKSYCDLLDGAFVLRYLLPFSSNLKKRMVKSPKLYIRDTGLLHALLGLESWDDLFGHPVLGFSWEALCLENILSRLHSSVHASFYRTARGAEIDLVLERGSTRMGIEFKASSAPRLQRGFWHAIEDLACKRNWIVAPVEEGYVMKNVNVSTLEGLLDDPDNRDFFKE